MNLRVAASQTTRGHRKNFVASVIPRLRRDGVRPIPEAPCKRRSEREPEGDVSRLDRRDHRGPEKEEPVTAPVPHAKDEEDRQRDHDEHRHHEYSCHL
jgi:hypothetical protein